MVFGADWFCGAGEWQGLFFRFVWLSDLGRALALERGLGGRNVMVVSVGGRKRKGIFTSRTIIQMK